MTNMTEREFLNAVLAIPSVDETIAEYAKAGIAKLDVKNDKRKNTKSKEQIANDGIKEQIVAYLRNGSAVAASVATALSITTQKASALCRQLVDEGKVSVKDAKAKGKGIVKEYSLITAKAEPSADAEPSA